MKMVKDPVCGMTVETDSAVRTAQHRGKTWYFCSDRCLDAFEREPDRYLRQSADDQPLSRRELPDKPIGTASDAVEYTCPMPPAAE